eukprot:TRINITY_DN19829_c0_g1_i1.p1 TRINITY_DN19829_c0_g1~~TRINITY_DN19829_c0_g1_i1.p1  ORF type:complete len:208 (+),score=17.55 TRINITY_DN19829_c0_g1_i1:33-656(+)
MERDPILSLLSGVHTLITVEPLAASEELRRCKAVIEFLIHSHATEGRKLAKILIEDGLLPPELVVDWQHLIQLGPGWCDPEDDETISESAFTVATFLLVIFYLLNNLPDYLIPDPEQTINFKLGERTLVVDGTENLILFDPTLPKADRTVNFTLLEMTSQIFSQHLHMHKVLTESIVTQAVVDTLLRFIPQMIVVSKTVAISKPING